MWEVKFKFGIFRQKPIFLSRRTFLSRTNIAQEMECEFAMVTGIALSESSYSFFGYTPDSILSQILELIENC